VTCWAASSATALALHRADSGVRGRRDHARRECAPGAGRSRRAAPKPAVVVAQATERSVLIVTVETIAHDVDLLTLGGAPPPARPRASLVLRWDVCGEQLVVRLMTRAS
jgi:hypothetical protein